MGDTGKITYLNQGHTFWDQVLLLDLLERYSGERQVFVVPGAINEVDEVNMEMEHFNKVLVIITSDEENQFKVGDLYHPDMKILMTYPNRRDVDGYLPIGYTPRTRELVRKNGMSAKSLDFFFAGQDTHDSRHACIKVLKDLEGGKLVPTEGFAQGLEYEEYMVYMCRAKVVPCPGGPLSPDSFRLYEALEAGCIPIPENKVFWTMLFGDVPFPIVDDWSELPELIKHYKDRPDVNNKCQAWWQTYKRMLKWQLLQY